MKTNATVRAARDFKRPFQDDDVSVNPLHMG